jgi:hypothetical protein
MSLVITRIPRMHVKKRQIGDHALPQRSFGLGTPEGAEGGGAAPGNHGRGRQREKAQATVHQTSSKHTCNCTLLATPIKIHRAISCYIDEAREPGIDAEVMATEKRAKSCEGKINSGETTMRWPAGEGPERALETPFHENTGNSNIVYGVFTDTRCTAL